MTMFMMANDSNYEEEKLANEGIEENAEVEMPTVSIVNNVHKEKEKFSIYNMKAVARKMNTPGNVDMYDESDDSDI